MAMAVVRRLRFSLCRASRAHKTGRCTGCVLIILLNFVFLCFLPFFCHSPLATAGRSGEERPWLYAQVVGGLVRSATPIVLPVRGHLDSIKQLMLGDLYIGRGPRQRGLKKSLWCNPFKVSACPRSIEVCAPSADRPRLERRTVAVVGRTSGVPLPTGRRVSR